MWAMWWYLALLAVVAAAAAWERHSYLRRTGQSYRWMGVHRAPSRWARARPLAELRAVLAAAAPDDTVELPRTPAGRPVVDWSAAT